MIHTKRRRATAHLCVLGIAVSPLFFVAHAGAGQHSPTGPAFIGSSAPARHAAATAPPGTWGRPSSETRPPSRPMHRPGTVAARTVNTSEVDASDNWAGIAGTGSTFTDVSATWTVPAVQPSTTQRYSATWLGIDGVSNNNLIQTGTEQDAGPDGTSYSAWYEILPHPPHQIGLVSPGDVMHAEISEVSAGSWTISIEDTTSGDEVAGTVPYSGPANSSEWIEEAPSNESGNILPLADFGSVHFASPQAGVTDPSSISQHLIAMVDNAHDIIAYPANVTDDSFDVIHGSPSTATTTTSSSTSTSTSTSTSSTSTTVAPASRRVTRVSGPSRIDTALAVSATSFPGKGGAAAAVLSRDDAFADALAGTPLAAAKGGPLLLNPTAALDARVSAELTRILPPGATVYLLGGAAALSDAVATAVTNLGFNVVRFAGADRFETATIIADKGLGNPSVLLEATGRDFPDALTAGAAAAAHHGAVILTDGTGFTPGTVAYINAHLTAGRYAIGGAASAADPAPTTTRLVGADRYETAKIVADTFFTRPRYIGLASGQRFPDAIAGSAQIAHLAGPMLLSDPATLSAPTQTYLAANASGINATYIYGGALALAATVSSAAYTAIGGVPPVTFSDGQYHVGQNLAAGTYRTRADSAGCYWERESGFSGQASDIIANDVSDFHEVVTVATGDAGFKSSRCGTWTSDLSPLTSSPTAAFGSGTWIVGTDIAPGRWTAPGGSKCYWQRSSGFSGPFGDIIANDGGTINPIVTISASDAGFVTRDCGTWAKSA